MWVRVSDVSHLRKCRERREGFWKENVFSIVYLL
jgi:hypothetical protein